MTDTQTQFQVGKVYATRGGDRVMHTEVDKDSPYPLAGYFLSGPRQRDFGNWCANGRYREDCEHPLDLLPTPFPDPAAPAADDKAELLAALREIETWSRAYPVSAFPEPDFKRVRELLEAGGITLDSVSASILRNAIKGVGDIARRAIAKAERT